MTNNPLKKFFRQPSVYLSLPTMNKWYTSDDIDLVNKELPVYGLSAIDDILLNTPDAMLNGQALEKVIEHCVPNIKNVRNLMLPDLEAIFVAIKIATNNGKFDYDKNCPSCKHENNFELNCQSLLDTMSFVDESDTVINFDDDLKIFIRPYNFEMRQLYMQKEFEEERLTRSLMSEELDEFTKQRLFAESVDRMSRTTFDLVSMSIEKIQMIKENIVVTDHAHINEWLTSITTSKVKAVMNAVNKLNEIGVNKKIEVQCQSCGHTWTDQLNFDPINFFGKRS